jgi:hypothetical protein
MLWSLLRLLLHRVLAALFLKGLLQFQLNAGFE